MYSAGSLITRLSTPAVLLMDVKFFNSDAVGGELPPLVAVLMPLILWRVRVIAG
jgi:hypothetical protein